MPAWAPLHSVPELQHLAPRPAVPPLSPGGVPPPLQPPIETDSTGGLIPYKNPKALVAYYLGVVALVPFIGIFVGIASIALGIKGLHDRKQKPAIRGGAHAWVGIALGSFSLFYHLVAFIFLSTR